MAKVAACEKEVQELELKQDYWRDTAKEMMQQLAACEKERDMWKETDLRDAARVDELARQLTASQAREQQLREALELLWAGTESSEWDAIAQEHFRALIKEPNDTSALDELRKDSARYQFLRNGSNWPAVFNDYDEPEPLRCNQLDAAIEAAMEGK